MGCYGDGGAILTDDDWAEIIKSLRFHGKGTHKYNNVRIGLNARLDTIQASILLEKLKVFDTELAHKELAASKYTRALKNYLHHTTYSKRPEIILSSIYDKNNWNR